MTSAVTYSSGNYDNSARQAFHGLMDTASDHYENKLLRIAGCLAEKVSNHSLHPQQLTLYVIPLS